MLKRGAGPATPTRSPPPRTPNPRPPHIAARSAAVAAWVAGGGASCWVRGAVRRGVVGVRWSAARLCAGGGGGGGRGRAAAGGAAAGGGGAGGPWGAPACFQLTVHATADGV